MCATKAEYACNYMYMYFGVNVQHTNNRLINTISCVKGCKLDKCNTDNIGSDLHIGNMDYEI